MKFINFKLGLVAIAVTASPLGTFATTAGNLAVVNLLPPPSWCYLHWCCTRQ